MEYSTFVKPMNDSQEYEYVTFSVTFDMEHDINGAGRPVQWVDTITWDRGLFNDDINKQIDDNLKDFRERYQIENKIMELVHREHELDYD